MSRRKAKSSITYGWKYGAHVAGGLDSQVVGARLESLRQANGQLTAAITVEDARPVAAPLHPVFEWDDAAAAEQYRLEQARALIRSVVVIAAGQPDAVPIRAFVVIGEVGEQSYTATHLAMEDPELRRQVVARALKELRSIQAKYREVTELAKVFEAIDQIAA